MNQYLHKTMTQKINKPKKNKAEWLQAMIEEIDAIIVETRFSSQETIIRGKHAIGQAIIQNESNATADELCAVVAGDLGVSKRTIQQAVQFYKVDPELKVLEQGKDISWRKILKSMQEPREKKEEEVIIEHIWFNKPLSDCKKKELMECIKHLVKQFKGDAESYVLDKI